MPADPIADFLISRGVDPEAFVIALLVTTAIGGVLFLVHAATSGVEF